MTNLVTSQAAHVDPSNLPVINHLDFLSRVLVSGEQTGGSFSVVEQRARLGCMTPRHLHGRESETFLVVDGALEGWCDGATTLVEAGQLLHLPAGREHAFRVASGAAHFYNVISPAGFEAFFPATGTPVAQAFDGELPLPGPVPPGAAATLERVLASLGCQLVGPPPFPVG